VTPASDLEVAIARIEATMVEREKSLRDRFDAAEEARRLAADVVEHRLEGMNLFRAQVLEERALYVRRNELDLRISAILERIESVERAASHREGRWWMLPTLFAAIFVLLAVIVRELARGTL
jgi:hypothetical protein